MSCPTHQRSSFKKNLAETFLIKYVAPWCNGYEYCTTSFNKAWAQVLCRFKSCSRRVGYLRWWGSLTMVPAGSKAKRLSLVNHITKPIHHHHILCRVMTFVASLLRFAFLQIYYRANFLNLFRAIFAWILKRLKEEKDNFASLLKIILKLETWQ